MTAVPATLRLRREGVLRSRAARGDAAAFAAVYERHHQALYRYCRSILHHEQDAQDALQSTMTRAFAALQDEQRDFELRPWLFRIAHNEAISIVRRRRETPDALDDVPAAADLEDRVSEREELRLLSADLADLPERQRAALVLRELNGLSHAEIAVVLEISVVAVKQSIFEARSALFSCREGREMACHDVRRMLSDGDGRVLRGRGVRAHLRTCSGCRLFQADLAARPKRLRMLAPPLPTAGAAALLGQLLGGSGAKLLACVAIAGGGTTLAVEVQQAREAPRAAAAETKATPTPRPAAPARRTPVPTAVPASVTVPTSTTVAPTKAPAEKREAKRPATKPKRRRAATPPRENAQAVAPVPTEAVVDVKPEKPPKVKPTKPEKVAKTKPEPPTKVKPEKVPRVKPEKAPKVEPAEPPKVKKVKPEPPAAPVIGPDAEREKRTPPGQVKKHRGDEDDDG